MALDYKAAIFYPFTRTNSPTLPSEHQLLLDAKPRFPGHEIKWYALPSIGKSERGEPELVFDWQYTTESQWDDSDPAVMRRHCELLVYAGIDTILFVVSGGELNAAGEVNINSETTIKTFLSIAKEYPQLKMGFIVAFTAPRMMLPVPYDAGPDFEREERQAVCNDECIERLLGELSRKYAGLDNYLKIDSRPVFFFFDAVNIAHRQEQDYSIPKMQELFTRLRADLEAELGQQPFFLGRLGSIKYANTAALIGFDAVFGYIDLPMYNLNDEGASSVQEYSELIDLRIAEWAIFRERFPDRVYLPSAAPGWDATSRAEQGYGLEELSAYPALPVVINNSPELFQKYLEANIQYVSVNPPGMRISIIGAYNEMTESATIIPSYDPVTKEIDAGFLEVVRQAFQG